MCFLPAEGQRDHIGSMEPGSGHQAQSGFKVRWRTLFAVPTQNIEVRGTTMTCLSCGFGCAIGRWIGSNQCAVA